MTARAAFPREAAREVARRGLDEDLGGGGDITTKAVFPDGRAVSAGLVAREPLVLAGLPFARELYDELERRGQGVVQVELLAADGDAVETTTVVARLMGEAHAVLAGERLLLNLVSRLSGVATTTAAAVAEVGGSRCRVSDTRKTTPGLRELEKYAVACGGGENHRPRLDAQILVKDNHKHLIGGIRAAIEAVRAAGHALEEAEFEVDTLDELRVCLELGVGWILLDNMSLDEIREAVAMTAGRARLEVSGGVRPGALAALASTGVDRLSMGFLTHSVRSMDLALDLDEELSS